MSVDGGCSRVDPSDAMHRRPLLGDESSEVTPSEMNEESPTAEPAGNTNVSSDSQLKITILSLSGVHVACRRDGKSDIAAQYDDEFSITASVSFMGSCDPDDLRVVSSGLCSTSGRLCVESRPIIVPHGMTDNLVAVWDDCPTTAMLPSDSSFSSMHHGLKRGKIPGGNMANPHLYIKLKDNEESNMAMKSANGESSTERPNPESTKSMTATDISATPTVAETEISSTVSRVDALHHGEIEVEQVLDETRHQSNTARIDTRSQSSPHSPVVLFEVHKGKHLKEELHGDRSHQGIDSNEALVNTPSINECSDVPEILQMQIALHVNVLPSDECEYDDTNQFVRSACQPSVDDGGAVAHLVLFPDILDFDTESLQKQLADEGQCMREMELPVRKRRTPKSSRSCEEQDHFNGYAWVDLDETAMIRVRLERCSSDEELPFSPNGEQLDFCRKSNEKDIFGDDGSIMVLSPNPSSCQESDSRTISSNDKTPSCNQKERKQNEQKSVNHETLHEYSGMQGNMQREANAHANAKQCSAFEGIFEFLSKAIGHCGEDVTGYQIDQTFSMDNSTIVTDLGH